MNKSKDGKSRRGFYIALYSCLGLALIAASVMTFYSLRAPKETEEPIAGVDLSQYQQTAQSDTKSYLTPSDRTATPTPALPKSTPSGTSQSTPQSTPQPKVTPAPQTSLDEQTESEETTENKPAETKPANEQKPAEQTESEKKPESQPKPKETSSQDEAKDFESLAEPVFGGFSDNDKMIWPVLGEVVMDYSMDRTIYDQTLDQYRTNDAICIAAPQGTQVRATAEGIVASVTRTRENGNTIVIDNGNGWLTTYSQLQDGVLVKEGDYVKPGQVIGGVGSPSIYSVMLGNHVSFKITKNDQVIDPKTVLEQ